jgi:hypothetical protein
MMFSMQRIGRSAKTPMTTAVNQALARQAKSAFGTAALNLSLTRANKPTVNVFPIQTRSLSLQALDMAAVRQIKAELMEVDANGNPDGRYAEDDKEIALKMESRIRLTTTDLFSSLESTQMNSKPF